MRSPQNFSSVGVHRSKFEYGALGLVSIISPSSKLRIVHHFFLWTPCSSRNILSKFQFFSQPARPVPKVSVQLEFIGALGLVLIISSLSELEIMHRYFLWTPCSSRNILSKFQKFSQPA